MVFSGDGVPVWEEDKFWTWWWGWLHSVSVPRAAGLYPENGKFHAMYALLQFNKVNQERWERCRGRTLERVGIALFLWKGF